MKLKGNDKLYATLIGKYIESIGGRFIEEAASGSIYYSGKYLGEIRISDHITIKKGIDKISVLIVDNHFVCLNRRNVEIFHKLSEVKTWIKTMDNAYHAYSIYAKSAVEYHNDMKEVNIKLNNMSQECAEWHKKYNIANAEITHLNASLRKSKEKNKQITLYNNKWQTTLTVLNKICKKYDIVNDPLLDDLDLF